MKKSILGVLAILYSAFSMAQTSLPSFFSDHMVWVDVGFGGTVGTELRGDILNGRLLDSGSNRLPGLRE